MATYKKIEVVGTSSKSVADAVKSAVASASKSVRNVSWFEVAEIRGAVKGGEVSWQPEDDPLSSRLNTARKILDFGPVATNGAFRMTGTGKRLTVTPLPGSDAFEVSIPAHSGAVALDVQTADLAGKPDGQLNVKSGGGRFVFTVPAGTRRCLLSFR